MQSGMTLIQIWFLKRLNFKLHPRATPNMAVKPTHLRRAAYFGR